MGCIYIMTNPALRDMVKIGYATDVETRRRQLSTTALPYEYEIYATYETPGNLTDKKLHKLIDKLNPDLRVSKNREFFIMTPHDAYELLEVIAIVSGSEDKLQLLEEVEEEPCQKPQRKKRKKRKRKKQTVRKPSVNFYECGLKDGDELVYVEDSSVRVAVSGPRKVVYGDEITSLSAIVQRIKGIPAAAGPSYFTFNGEPLVDIAYRTQWRSYVED